MTTDVVARPPRYAPGMHPNSRANLKPPYKPGENGHGRVYPLKERLAHALDHPLTEPKADAPAGDHLVYATLKAAIEIIPVAFRETWDRVEGKVPGDQPPVNQDNRVLNVIVLNEQTKNLIADIAGWTKKPPVGAETLLMKE